LSSDNTARCSGVVSLGHNSMTTTAVIGDHLGLLDKERIIAPAEYNRWLVPPAALAIHLCIGMAYGFSVFWKPLQGALLGADGKAVPECSAAATGALLGHDLAFTKTSPELSRTFQVRSLCREYPLLPHILSAFLRSCSDQYYSSGE